MAEEEKTCLKSLWDVENCNGTVTMRTTDAGTDIWECAFHMEQSIRRNEEIERRYPKNPPKWFDPTFAGEVWEEDE